MPRLSFPSPETMSAEQRRVHRKALVGCYTMVAMTLNAHEIPLPDGVTPAFPRPQATR